MDEGVMQDPEEFLQFHAFLTCEKPDYVPWYFKLSEDKDPSLSVGSWKAPTARITVEQAIRHLQGGKNVGIAATGDDGLVIIDIDDIKITSDDQMHPTLSATSRKRIGRHYFYFTKDIKAKRNIATEDAGEVRATWQYVVAPGSYVNTGETEIMQMPEEERGMAGRYTLLNATPPSLITFEQFPEIFREQIRRNEEMEQEMDRIAEERKAQKANQPSDVVLRSAIYDLDVFDVVGKRADLHNRFPSLFHGSKTGKNTAVYKKKLTCWRHNVTHNGFSALAVLCGAETCLAAGTGIRGSGGGRSSVDHPSGSTLFRMWCFAKRNGIIPDDDPIPGPAFRWYAARVNVCNDEADWLSETEYDQTVICMEQFEKIDSGRRRSSTL